MKEQEKTRIQSIEKLKRHEETVYLIHASDCNAF